MVAKIMETDEAQPEYEPGIRKIALDSLTAGITNVRSVPRKEDVLALAQSIKTRGLEHPILVRPAPNNPGMFEVIAGSQRVAAAQELGMKKIDARVVHADDAQALQLSADENEKRGNLSARELGEVIKRLMNLYPADPGDENAVLKWVARSLGWFQVTENKKGKAIQRPDVTRVKKALEDAEFQEMVPGIEVKVRSRGDFRRPTAPLSVARQVMPILTEPRVKETIEKLPAEHRTKAREEFLRAYADTPMNKRKDLKESFVSNVVKPEFIQKMQANSHDAIAELQKGIDKERALLATVAVKLPMDIMDRIETHQRHNSGWTRSDAIKDLLLRGLQVVDL